MSSNDMVFTDSFDGDEPAFICEASGFVKEGTLSELSPVRPKSLARTGKGSRDPVLKGLLTLSGKCKPVKSGRYLSAAVESRLI